MKYLIEKFTGSNNCLHIYRGADYADFHGFTVKDGMAYGVIDGKIAVTDPSTAMYFKGQGFTLYCLTEEGWEMKHWDEDDCRLQSTIIHLRNKKFPLLPFCGVVTCDTRDTNIKWVYKKSMEEGFSLTEIELLRTVYNLPLLGNEDGGWYDTEY